MAQMKEYHMALGIFLFAVIFITGVFVATGSTMINRVTLPITDLSVVNHQNPTVALCRDTDGGDNIRVKGTLTDINGRSHVDLCISSSTVIEYFCSHNTLQNRTELCPSGTACSDGACRSKSVPK